MTAAGLEGSSSGSALSIDVACLSWAAAEALKPDVRLCNLCLDGEFHDQVSHSADGQRARGRPQATVTFWRECRQNIVIASAWCKGPQTLLSR